MKQNDELFSEEELAIINKTRDTRNKLIDELTEDGVPTRAGDIRVLNETLDAADRQVLDIVKLKKSQQEDNSDRMVGMVVELLSKVTSNNPVAYGNNEINLPDEYIPVDVVPGETDIGAEELSLSDFIEVREDDD